MSVDYGLGLGPVLEELGLNKGNTAGAILIGSMASYILYGIAACQVMTYYWKFPDDPFQLKLHVAMVWLVETTNAFLMVLAVWHYIIKRGADSSSFEDFILCNDWTLLAQSIPTEVCCFLVEIFFIMRMWRMADSKQVAVITVVPFLAGWGFNIAYCVERFHLRCFPDYKVNNRWLISSYCSRILVDGLVAGTMCYMLWTRRPDSAWKSNTMRMISHLIMWSLTTGLLMWISAVGLVVSSTLSLATLIPNAVYLLRGRIHSNTMLAILNSRQHMRRLIDETIPLEIHDTEVHEPS
ncbi:hypothetical protein BDN70DRAFT_996479 [Pholiota conissans]|uniref:DUF6534 domain-containing protein n=1 Tax=Pholiota conissans TaxID=109636 RepID=A0A9P5YVH6_9AGAR|nr:hypothetical protein BDN70DRAFT_996479 [Pholiota conissans]